MSLDLVKNALYQAVKTAIPALVFYPEVVDFRGEAFPNLCFQGIDSVRLGVRPLEESVLVATNQALPNPPFLRYPVLEAYRTAMTLQLRDSLGKGPRDAAAYQRIRDTFNAVDRFLARDATLTTAGGTLADVNYRGNRQAQDAASGIFLHAIDLEVEWRLLDDTDLPTFTASSIEVDVSDLATGQIRIALMLTP